MTVCVHFSHRYSIDSLALFLSLSVFASAIALHLRKEKEKENLKIDSLSFPIITSKSINFTARKILRISQRSFSKTRSLRKIQQIVYYNVASQATLRASTLDDLFRKFSTQIELFECRMEKIWFSNRNCDLHSNVQLDRLAKSVFESGIVFLRLIFLCAFSILFLLSFYFLSLTIKTSSQSIFVVSFLFTIKYLLNHYHTQLFNLKVKIQGSLTVRFDIW